MAGWNGSGTYSRYHDWTTDESGAVNIDATRMDQEDDAIAAGINACLTKNGENSPSANLPMANYKHTGVGAGTALTHYADVASVQNSGYHYAASTGTDTYAITLSPTPAAYATGQAFNIKVGTANTGASTINVNSLGAKDLVKGVSTALVAGDLVTNQIYTIVYDGTRFAVTNRELNTSATTSGIVELATDAETVTGTDTARATTPANITAKMAAPGTIGGTTPGAATFTTLNSTGGVLNGSLGATTPAAATVTSLTSSGLVKSSSASAGVGYATGAGGTVTQITSKTTAVTLSKICGQIVTHNASLNNATTVGFTVTNTTVAATDTVALSIALGASTIGAYVIWVENVTTNAFDIYIRNFSGGALGEAITINFAVIKAVAA